MTILSWMRIMPFFGVWVEALFILLKRFPQAEPENEYHLPPVSEVTLEALQGVSFSERSPDPVASCFRFSLFFSISLRFLTATHGCCVTTPKSDQNWRTYWHLCRERLVSVRRWNNWRREVVSLKGSRCFLDRDSNHDVTLLQMIGP